MIVGISTTSNQLEAGSIMVRAMKSIEDPSLPLRVYGPTRSTHKASQGVLITILDGRCPYFVYVFYSLGKICITLLWIGRCFSFLSSILQISMSPRDVYAQGAVDHCCTPLQWLRNYEPTFIAYTTFVFDKLKFQSFIQNSEQHCI